MMKRSKLFITFSYLLSAIWCFSACALIDEGECMLNYIEYRYLNNIGEDATYRLNTVKDFIFTSDSVLYRVDESRTGNKISKRPVDLPDGDWIIYSYANLNGRSTIKNYVIGKTRLADMSLRVTSPSSYTGTYAPAAGTPTLRVGNSDPIYFGKVALTVKDGYTDHTQVVDMSNVHIWLNGTIRWKSPINPLPKIGENLHIRLEYIPVEFGFNNDDKMDRQYKIPYSTPRITEELVTFSTKLSATSQTNEYTFQMYGLRWETGRAPVLRIYDGETLLVTKDLPLNKYFEDQNIDLSHTRVQFYNLLIEVDGDTVYISDLSIADWEDGGSW